jgi:hypothetical protein
MVENYLVSECVGKHGPKIFSKHEKMLPAATQWYLVLSWHFAYPLFINACVTARGHWFCSPYSLGN